MDESWARQWKQKKDMDLKETEGKRNKNQGYMRAEEKGSREARTPGKGPCNLSSPHTSSRSAQGCWAISSTVSTGPSSHLTFNTFWI